MVSRERKKKNEIQCNVDKLGSSLGCIKRKTSFSITLTLAGIKHSNEKVKFRVTSISNTSLEHNH